MTTEQNRSEDVRPAGEHETAGSVEGESLETPPHQRGGRLEEHHDEPERAQDGPNPGLDPSPDETPGLEEGGSVRPGDTPPDSNSATASPSQEAPTSPPKSKAVLTTAVIAIAVVVLLIFVGYIAGILGS
ncbi:DUF6480 family protein [Nesterenkonia halotolerans]|uniref:DUF6480 family protein n=1 Tax=Nesterenkonia halotolerans TaxID=225325 RepID=UPI003EE5F7BE